MEPLLYHHDLERELQVTTFPSLNTTLLEYRSCPDISYDLLMFSYFLYRSQLAKLARLIHERYFTMPNEENSPSIQNRGIMNTVR